MIPFLNRSTDIVFSPQLEARDVNVREVIDELQSQFEDFNSVFEAVVLLSPGRYRVTCKSSRKLEIFSPLAFWYGVLPSILNHYPHLSGFIFLGDHMAYRRRLFVRLSPHMVPYVFLS